MPRADATFYEETKNRLAVVMLAVLGRLPFAVNRALGWLLGWLMALLPNPARHVTKVNLKLCLPEKTRAERRRLRTRSLVETGKGMAEIALLWHRPKAGLSRIRAVEGAGPLDEAVKAGEPVVLLVPHLGCWEVLNFWLSSHYPFHAMFNPSGLPDLDAHVRRGREHYGSTLHPATAKGVVGLVRALRRGAVTAILPDQVPNRASGRYAPFFGHECLTGTLSCKLIRQSGARVFMARAERLPGTKGYTIHISDPDPGIQDEDLDRALAAMNRSVETQIRQRPDQYLWSYKRFRRVPDRSQLY